MRDGLHHFVLSVETGFQHGQSGRELRILFQVTYGQIAAENHLAAVVIHPSGDDVEQGGLSGAVGGDQSDALTFIDSERDILE